MSGSYLYVYATAKFSYIADVFDTLILRDIRRKHRIRNAALMNAIADFLMDNVAGPVSLRKIARVLNDREDRINRRTVGSYLGYLCNAFAFYKVRRFDIQGKKYLSSSDKYYLSDYALRYAKQGAVNLGAGRMIEDIAAPELLGRGYEVYVGVLCKKEIDFVAVRRSGKLYLQVAGSIGAEGTFGREASPLPQVRDAYPKVLLAGTGEGGYRYGGVRIADVADRLAERSDRQGPVAPEGPATAETGARQAAEAGRRIPAVRGFAQRASGVAAAGYPGPRPAGEKQPVARGLSRLQKNA